MPAFTRSLSLLLLSLTATAHADDTRQQAKQAFTLGQSAYNAGQYRAAALSFKLAYELDHLAPLLFNMAQAWRRDWQLTAERGSLEQAVTGYRQYLASVTGTNDADRRESAQQLQQLGPILDGELAEEAAKLAASKVVLAPPIVERRRRRDNLPLIIGISVGGAAVLALTLGLGLGLGLRGDNGPPTVTPRF